MKHNVSLCRDNLKSDLSVQDPVKRIAWDLGLENTSKCMGFAENTKCAQICSRGKSHTHISVFNLWKFSINFNIKNMFSA
jgi:hypothetical protein